MQHHLKISVTGLGYVGLMIAAAFAKKNQVIGLDISKRRIDELKQGFDRNGELSSEELHRARIQYTDQPQLLKKANFHIIAVPTPVDASQKPDLSILLAASETVGKQLKKGDVVVYESSVYPGATEEKCIPILEKASHLVCGKDFGVGYSPERINPGDKTHLLDNIPKIISAVNEKSLKLIAKAYGQIVKAGLHPVSSIRIAEATKIIENIQRDINISFVNEIALILHSLGMDSKEVLEAARTKWNFLPFTPGLVGGHCVGVNSCYLTYKAEEVGCHPNMITAGRRVNEQMPKFIVESAIKELIQLDVPIKQAKVAILGITYKENCPDIHDTRIVDIIRELSSYGVQTFVHDPIANPTIALKEFGITLKDWKDLSDMDAVMIMVAHDEYSHLTSKDIQPLIKKQALLMDIKGILNQAELKIPGLKLWCL